MLGLYWDNGKEHGNYYSGLYRAYIGVMWGSYWDNGKENGNYYSGLYRGYIEVILGLYWDNGKENGNYYLGLGDYASSPQVPNTGAFCLFSCATAMNFGNLSQEPHSSCSSL